MSCVESFFICFSCLTECCNAVLLWHCRHVSAQETSLNFPLILYKMISADVLTVPLGSTCSPEYFTSQSTVLVNNKCRRAINLFYFSFATTSSSSSFIKSFLQVLYSNIWKHNSPAGAAGGGGTELDSGTTAGSGTGAGDTGSIGG